MESLIDMICLREGIKSKKIQVLQGGQVNQVYRINEDYILRIATRDNANQRLKRETELIQSLQNAIPVPEIYAFGEKEGMAYQIQQFIPGQRLHAIWRDLPPDEQDRIVAELAAYLRILHRRTAPHFGYLFDDTQPYSSWAEYLSHNMRYTFDEIEAYQFRMAPGFVEMAWDYFEEHKHVLQDAAPVIVHGDLSLVNILANQGKISAILDFEYAMQAPKDYELCVLENFCLYPNDYAEEDNEVFCTGDFAGFIPLLRKHYPELFDTRTCAKG